jgi:hypothetical protein
MFGRAEVLEAAAELGQDQPVNDLGLEEQLLSVGSTDWSPEQTEQYIDWRVQVIDAEISKLRKQLEDLMGARKRWLAVTGGRSKIGGSGTGTSSNGGTNGHTGS